ncbi:MAG: VWA domain-containing protein [Thermoanaerobaculia bacterium]
MTGYSIRILEFGPPVRVVLLCALLGGSIMPTVQAWADQEEQDRSVFSEVVQVHVVNVDVYATDKKGNPVEDLTAADFEISEDGQPMEITHFSRLTGEEAAAGAVEPRAGPTTPPGKLGLEEPGVGSPGERLWLVVYIDNTNLRTFDRKRALEQLRECLDEGIGTHTDVMVASYDRTLNVRLPFTSDPARVTESLVELEATRCHGERFDSERRDFLERLDIVSNQIEAVEMLRPFAEQVLGDLTLTLDALGEMVDRISGLPGRKAILYVSSGLPRLAAMDLFMAIENRFPFGYALYKKRPFDATSRFDELTAIANAHGVTLYTIGAGGVPASGPGGVEQNSLRSVSAVSSLEMDRSANLQLPLRQLADDTGGQAIINRNDLLPALRKVADDFQSYYSIGYTPDHTGDGQFHTIAVEVTRPGVRLRHRSGYRDKSMNTRMSEGVRAALTHAVDDNPLGVVVEIGEESVSDSERFLVPIQVTIPLGEVVLLPDGAVIRGRLRLFLAAMDEEGRTTEVLEIPSEIEFPDGDTEGAPDYWRFSTNLRMRGGRHTISLGVRDELGAVSAFTTHTLTVGDR